MTIREMIEEELDKLSEDRLVDVLQMVRSSGLRGSSPPGEGLMARLRGIRIDGPADFSENLDDYLTGEKRIEDHLP